MLPPDLNGLQARHMYTLQPTVYCGLLCSIDALDLRTVDDTIDRITYSHKIAMQDINESIMSREGVFDSFVAVLFVLKGLGKQCKEELCWSSLIIHHMRQQAIIVYLLALYGVYHQVPACVHCPKSWPPLLTGVATCEK